MPEITVKITKGPTEAHIKSTEIKSNNLPDLLTSLKSAKEDTNSALTKIVDESKGSKKTKKESTDDDGCSSDDDAAAKKQKL